jgi:hypothetical protein
MSAGGAVLRLLNGAIETPVFALPLYTAGSPFCEQHDEQHALTIALRLRSLATGDTALLAYLTSVRNALAQNHAHVRSLYTLACQITSTSHQRTLCVDSADAEQALFLWPALHAGAGTGERQTCVCSSVRRASGTPTSFTQGEVLLHVWYLPLILAYHPAILALAPAADEHAPSINELYEEHVAHACLGVIEAFAVRGWCSQPYSLLCQRMLGSVITMAKHAHAENVQRIARAQQESALAPPPPLPDILQCAAAASSTASSSASPVAPAGRRRRTAAAAAPTGERTSPRETELLAGGGTGTGTGSAKMEH